jgi:hypothetical protein
MEMPTLHWQLSEQAAAIRYRLLAAGSADGFKPGLVARVGVPSEYVAPLVERAFAIHPAMYSVVDAEEQPAADSRLPDLIVSAAGSISSPFDAASDAYGAPVGRV